MIKQQLNYLWLQINLLYCSCNHLILPLAHVNETFIFFALFIQNAQQDICKAAEKRQAYACKVQLSAILPPNRKSEVQINTS